MTSISSGGDDTRLPSGAPHIRPLARDEMHLPIDWAAAEGWNPGLYDAQAFFAADPE